MLENIKAPLALGLETDEMTHQIINSEGWHVATVDCSPVGEYSKLFIASPECLQELVHLVKTICGDQNVCLEDCDKAKVLIRQVTGKEYYDL